MDALICETEDLIDDSVVACLSQQNNNINRNNKDRKVEPVNDASEEDSRV